MTPLEPAPAVALAPGGLPKAARSRRLLPDLERPADAFRHLGPNWYASVMGTGIVANAAALLPVHVPGLQACFVSLPGYLRLAAGDVGLSLPPASGLAAAVSGTRVWRERPVSGIVLVSPSGLDMT